MNNDLTHKVILLADDDQEDAEMFSMVLADIAPAIKFYHVSNGSAVLDYFNEQQNNTPDIIFLDLNMPEMNGWQCLSSLQNNLETKQIPVLIYSTSSQPRDKQIAKELGASAFITKPSEYKTLQKILTTVAVNIHRDSKNMIESLRKTL